MKTAGRAPAWFSVPRTRAVRCVLVVWTDDYRLLYPMQAVGQRYAGLTGFDIRAELTCYGPELRNADFIKTAELRCAVRDERERGCWWLVAHSIYSPDALKRAQDQISTVYRKADMAEALRPQTPVVQVPAMGVRLPD